MVTAEYYPGPSHCLTGFRAPDASVLDPSDQLLGMNKHEVNLFEHLYEMSESIFSVGCIGNAIPQNAEYKKLSIISMASGLTDCDNPNLAKQLTNHWVCGTTPN